MKGILFTFLFCLPVWLFAQDSQQQLSLDELVVTANKFDQKASQTGKVITVITQKDLQHESGKTLGAVLNEQPGITINGSGGTPGTNQTLYLRGADPKYTLILIDGVPVSDVSYINNEFDLNLIPLTAIERIEIMRGGYSTLYGSGAAAGVINIILKKGGQQPFNITVGLNAGSYHTFREQAGINGTAKNIDYNIQFQNVDTKGFSSALDTTGQDHFDDDGFHRKSVYANVGFHLKNEWVIRPFFNFADEKGGLDAGAFTDDKDYTYTSSFSQTGVGIKHRFNNGDLNITYSFNPISRHYLNDSLDGSAFEKDQFKSDVHTADIFAHLVINPSMSLLLGNYINMQRTDQRTNYISPYYSAKTSLSSDSAKSDMMSIYSSLLLKSDNGFHLELGGRLNQHNLYGFHPVFSINPSWLINDKIKIFANASSSFISPSLYQLYSSYGNKNLKPETGISYEGGVESLLAQDKLKIRLTGFDRSLKKVIAFQSSHYINYDRQHEYGGEAEINYAISSQLNLQAWYAFVKGNITVQNDQTKLDSTYNNLFKRPEHSAGMSMGYQITPALYVGLDGKYTGKRKDLVYIGYNAEERWLDAYALLDAYVQYVLKEKYKLFVSLHNITDSYYVETSGFSTKGFNMEAGFQWSLR